MQFKFCTTRQGRRSSTWGAFTRTYQSAIIIVADASRDHAFFEGLEVIRPELLRRFGTETDIHLVLIKLT
jgi:hypothetical protein